MKLIVFTFLFGVFVYWLLHTKSKTQSALSDKTSPINDKDAGVQSSRLTAAVNPINLSFAPFMSASDELIHVRSMLSDSEYLLY